MFVLCDVFYNKNRLQRKKFAFLLKSVKLTASFDLLIIFKMLDADVRQVDISQKEDPEERLCQAEDKGKDNGGGLALLLAPDEISRDALIAGAESAEIARRGAKEQQEQLRLAVTANLVKNVRCLCASIEEGVGHLSMGDLSEADRNVASILKKLGIEANAFDPKKHRQ